MKHTIFWKNSKRPFRCNFLNVLPKVWHIFCCHQQKIQKICFFFIFLFQGLQNSVSCLLKWISFFYVKFANFVISVLNFIRIWCWVYGLKDKIFKIKQYLICMLMVINQNILAILRELLDLGNNFVKNSTPSKLPQLLLNFLAKFLTKVSKESI